MEHMLLKMARQLNAMDEASLMALWDKYVRRVQDFDASQEWEEAAIMLTLIQAPKLKNQLFNARWLEKHPTHPESVARGEQPFTPFPWQEQESRDQKNPARTATVLPFRPRKKD